MRAFILRGLACLLLLTALPIMPQAEAATRRKKAPPRSRLQEDKAYSLSTVMCSPKEYLEREVMFYCRFATTANLFKSVNTRFNEGAHANFAVWPDKTAVWDVEGRKNVLPTLYIPKNNPDMLATLSKLKKYELIAITGYVVNVYAGFPWILVTDIEQIEQPGDCITEMVVEHMKSAADALAVNAGGVAARHFEQALKFGLPPEYRAKAYEQLAKSYLIDNQLDKALDYLRMATENGDCDALLHLALADTALKMGDPAESLAHCEFALERSGRYPQVYGIMGEARSLMGEYVKAFGDLNIAAGTPGISPRELAMINVRRARVYVRSGRLPDAARAYAAVSNPEAALAGESWLHNEIGLFYEKLYLEGGDARYLESASAAYAEAARLDRINAAPLYNMAEVEFRRQRLSGNPDFTQLKDILVRINQIEPDYTPARIVEGRLLFAEGKVQEAEYSYQSVADQIGDDANSLMAIAEAYADLGNTAGASAAAMSARSLQPWNQRVQALGKYLEAGGVAASAPGGAMLPASLSVEYPGAAGYETYAAPADGSTYVTVPYTVEGGSVQPEIIVPQATGESRIITDPKGFDPNAGTSPVASQTYVVPKAAFEQGNGAMMKSSGEWVEPKSWSMAPAAKTPVAAGNVKVYSFVDGSVEEIQSSAPPAGFVESYPVNEVQIPSTPAPVRSAPADKKRLDLGYNPSISAAPVVSSGQAYASIPVFADDSDLGGEMFEPPAFSFAPDTSPIIISGVTAPAAEENSLRARNANVYRRLATKRQPAEITESDPLPPRFGQELSAMSPNADGSARRAEVMLPDSAKGIGLASDYR